MTDDFENDAHEYLLDQMEAGRRRAFEQQLQRDPAARAALKACADSLARFACRHAPAERLAPATERAVAAAIMDAARPSPPVAVRPASWQRWFWPAAALLLLTLNVVDFERPLAVDPWIRPAEPRPQPAVATDSERKPQPDPRKQAENQAPDTTRSTPTMVVREQSTPERERARLHAEIAELEASHDRLRAAYDVAMRRLAAQADLNRDLNRLTTMELVDAASFARGERKGLVGMARGILAEPGIVIAPEPPSPSPPDLAASAPRAPYAWSVYDEKEHRGFLNLYHLPRPGDDHSLQVWVRPADSGEFQRVAEVPRELHGGSGRMQYSLAPPAAPPVEILVTIEPRLAPPALPSGPSVLRGP